MFDTERPINMQYIVYLYHSSGPERLFGDGRGLFMDFVFLAYRMRDARKRLQRERRECQAAKVKCLPYSNWITIRKYI